MWDTKQSSVWSLKHSLISDRIRPQVDLDEQASGIWCTQKDNNSVYGWSSELKAKTVWPSLTYDICVCSHSRPIHNKSVHFAWVNVAPVSKTHHITHFTLNFLKWCAFKVSWFLTLRFRGKYNTNYYVQFYLGLVCTFLPELFVREKFPTVQDNVFKSALSGFFLV